MTRWMTPYILEFLQVESLNLRYRYIWGNQMYESKFVDICHTETERVNECKVHNLLTFASDKFLEWCHIRLTLDLVFRSLKAGIWIQAQCSIVEKKIITKILKKCSKIPCSWHNLRPIPAVLLDPKAFRISFLPVRIFVSCRLRTQITENLHCATWAELARVLQ